MKNVCKKITTVNKHVNTRHTDQKWKMCIKVCSTSIELIHHVAKEHHEEEEVFNDENEEVSKSYEERKESSFKFSESMLNEFL